jgi:tRNA-specific 2-thiouridylase
VPVVVETEDRRLRIEFGEPQRGIAPGQSVVLYRGEELLGGARILDSFR